MWTNEQSRFGSPRRAHRLKRWSRTSTAESRESVIGNPGVERVVGVATEGLGQVNIEVSAFANPETVLDDVQNAVDRIENFPPVSAEQPEVLMSRPVREVMTLAVSSSVLTEDQLRLAAERLRDDLLALPSVSLVDLKGTRDREITIEISEEALRRNGLTLSEVSGIVRLGSVNLTAGELRTGAGGVVLQTLAKRQVGEEFLDIPLITRLDGTIVRLGDVAQIHDGFVDEELLLEVDGVPAVLVQVDATASQSVRDVAEIVRGALVDYPVPQDVAIDVWDDRASPVSDLLLTVVQNGLAGVALVFVCLVVMFDLRIAFWIAFGIPIAFIGALLFFGPAGLTLNVLTIFALFMLVGIVVDDAVVVGENIAAEREKGRGALDAAILGARGVAGPHMRGRSDHCHRLHPVPVFHGGHPTVVGGLSLRRVLRAADLAGRSLLHTARAPVPSAAVEPASVERSAGMGQGLDEGHRQPSRRAGGLLGGSPHSGHHCRRRGGCPCGTAAPAVPTSCGWSHSNRPTWPTTYRRI